MNSSEKVFYGGNTNFSYAACQWIEKQSELIGRHIHHALCGHGGEFYVTVKDDVEDREKEIPVDGYEPESKTIFQYYGCKWHGCPCRKSGMRSRSEAQSSERRPLGRSKALSPKERNSLEEERYAKTIELEKKMQKKHLKIVSVWECEKPELKKMRFKKKFRPFPYFIVYDFEALCKKMNEAQTEELTITSKHIPVSVAINDNLTKKPSFIVDKDPEKLIEKFVENVQERQGEIVEKVKALYLLPGGEEEEEEEENGGQ